MDTEDSRDTDLVSRLRRLDAAAAGAAPGFGYEGLIDRHAGKQRRTRRHLALARGTASALVIAMVGISVWRFDRETGSSQVVEVSTPAESGDSRDGQPRIVRADTYLTVAALEDHIATIDDALNDARLGRETADVIRLEQTRALLVDSYTRVRYAEMVNANF